MVTNTMELDGLATPDALILQLASRVSGAYIEMSDQENSVSIFNIKIPADKLQRFDLQLPPR